jgi:hypothetical protein
MTDRAVQPEKQARAASQERPQPDTLDIPCRHEFPHDGPCEPGVAQERPSIDVRAALREVAAYFGDGPLVIENGIVTRPAGGSVASPEPSWVEPDDLLLDDMEGESE